jgi:hypothetical protein
VLGILLFPATCSHAAGPHSLFIDPRETASPAAHEHADHPAANGDHQPSAAGSIGHQSTGTAEHPAGGLAWTDLPGTMLMSLAASVILLSTPQGVTLPTAQAPESLRRAPALRATPVPVDVPPPRAQDASSAAA